MHIHRHNGTLSVVEFRSRDHTLLTLTKRLTFFKTVGKHGFEKRPLWIKQLM
ncbi:hypothetical protein Hanom_Chr06g00566501 [Helianthus anomalus]